MVNFAAVGWVIGVTVMGVLAWFVYTWIQWLSRDRLMRCPETGAVTLVGVEPVICGGQKTAALEVQRCGLWPDRINCDRACLARYGETAAGYRVNIDALRPYEQR